MPMSVSAHQQIHVGTPTVIEAAAPSKRYMVVFEDDGETGYFYAVDPSQRSEPIQDAVQIYNVQQVTDRNLPSDVEIIWSSDNLKAVLLINKFPYAVFDFSAHQGFSRTDFPAAHGSWSKSGHAWSDRAMDLIK